MEERKERDLEGRRIHCLENKKGGEVLEGEGFVGKTWKNFVKTKAYNLS